jgi:hypothetical protein
MSIQSGSEQSAGYLTRLSAIVSAWALQIVSPPSQPHRAEAAQRLVRQVLTSLAVAAVSIAVLMFWFDAQEIALMPPRGTAGLWPFRVLTDFGKDDYVLVLLVVLLAAVTLVAPAIREPRRRRLLAIGLHLQFLFLAVSLPLAAGELLKWIAGRGRPFVGGHADAFNFVPFTGTGAY